MCGHTGQPALLSTFRQLICNRPVRLLLLLLCSQLVVVCFCFMSITSAILQRQHVNVPLFQNFCGYFYLALTFTVTLACRQGDAGLPHIMRDRGWKYLLLSIADVEAGFCVLSSYKYTTTTSVQILQCFSLPTVMLLSYCGLKTRYKLANYVGAVVSLVGMATLIYSDNVANGSSDPHANNEMLGDILALVGAVLYATENTMNEYFMKSCDIIEYIGSFMTFALPINAIQMLILERDRIAVIDFTSIDILTPLLGYVVCMYLGYTLVTLVIQRSSATWYNFNSLTANFYITILGIFLLNYKLNYLYFIALTLVVIGLLIYATRQPTSSEDHFPSLDTVINSGSPPDETQSLLIPGTPSIHIDIPS